MSAPDLYATLDSVQLNGPQGAWWNDFVLDSWPPFGGRKIKGDPGINVPGTDGELPVEVFLAPSRFSCLGVVYGDWDTDGDPVTGGLAAVREQLTDNLQVLDELVTQRVTGTLHHYSLTYEGDVTVVSFQQSTRDPFSPGQVGPIGLPVALELYFPAGMMTLMGS